MRRILALLLLAALAALVLLVLDGRTPPPGPARGPGGPEPGRAGGDAVPPGTGATPPAVADSPRAPLPLSPPGGEAEVAAPTTEAGAIRVQVLRAADGSPVPGAVVFRLDTADTGGGIPWLSPLRWQEVRHHLETSGRRFRANEGGELRIPPPQGILYLAGEAPGLFRLRRIGKDLPDEVIRLELLPDDAVQVRVTAADGTVVAGVPVLLARVRSATVIPLLEAETRPPGGLALLEHVRTVLAFYPSLGDLPPEVRLAIPLAGPVRAALDPEALPEEPLELRLPATGQVQVELRRQDGSLLPGETLVHLLRDPGAGTATEPDLSPAARAIARGGRAFFPHVGLGLELLASVRYPDRPFPVLARGRGPVRPGEGVVLRVQPEGAPTWLVGRALLPDGAPLAGTRLLGQVEAADPGSSTRDVQLARPTTDRDGRFRIPVRRPRVSRIVRRELVLALRSQDGSGAAVTTREARIPLPAELPAGEHDLGDVVLADVPILVAGTVLDARGAPVAGARVHVEVAGALRILDEPAWDPDWSIRQVTTAGDGTFRIRGAPADGLAGRPTRVVARKPGYQDGLARFAAGATGIVVRMQAAGRLAGSVLVDEGLRPELLSVLFIPEGGNGLPGRWRGRQFDWRDLPSCTGTVQFGLPGDSPPLLVVADVRVRAGVENRDPRLQDVDLRGRLTWIRLDLVDEGGNGVTEASVLELPAGGLAGRETVPGSVEILTDRPALDLLVQAPGYQWSILRGVRASREVVLRRAGTIRLRIPSLPALPEGVHLGVSLTLPGQEDALAPWNRTALFSAAGEAGLASPGPGEYRLQLFYQSSAGRVRTRRPAAEGVLLAPLLRVEEEAREAPFTLAVDPARLLAGAEAMP